ncbi:hypothetical protein [Rhizobium sp. NZLR8]|uniref:hypothetical protein n=1 Tax=Rhizobium sp. NZLR8 TaxID=2731104 RepID=UPI00287FA24F|nr:hypothetical protein [Rhizobium sp. NZLR8]
MKSVLRVALSRHRFTASEIAGPSGAACGRYEETTGAASLPVGEETIGKEGKIEVGCFRKTGKVRNFCL